jgi:hypothetical protein
MEIIFKKKKKRFSSYLYTEVESNKQTGLKKETRIVGSSATTRRGRNGIFARVIDRKCMDKLSAVAVVTHQSAVFGHHGRVRMSVPAYNHSPADLLNNCCTFFNSFCFFCVLT